jgi:hypothetical protein
MVPSWAKVKEREVIKIKNVLSNFCIIILGCLMTQN